MSASRLRLLSLVLPAGLAILLAGTSGCERSVSAAHEKVEEAAPVVEIVSPTLQTIRRVVEQPGQIEAEEQTALYARISGYVESWTADIGKQVKAGEVLATLSVPEMDQELRQKKAAVLQAEADVLHAERAVDSARANVQRAGAAVRQAEALRRRSEANLERWGSEYNRARRLLSGRVIPGTEFDATQDSYKTAQAAAAESEATVDLARSDQAARQADLAQAEAAVKVARSRLGVAEADRDRMAALVGFARIVAPFEGVITRRQVERGQLVQPPSGGTPGTPLFLLARTDRVRVQVDVPEAAAAQVRDGMPASVRVQALGQREFRGTVSRSSWALNTQTRTLRVEVDLENREGLLRPGLFVSLCLKTERPGAVMVPASAVYATADARPYLMCVEDGRTRRVHVQLGERQGAFVEVLRKRTSEEGETPTWEALSRREMIVAGNPTAYEDGQAVTIAPARKTESHGESALASPRGPALN
jgi:multidrug efflux pump subunit AcrA (membrane-fusion protein)